MRDIPLVKVGRKVTFTVRGTQYEATIDSISAHIADLRSPWRENDELHVWCSFEHTKGKFPGSTLSFAVTLPIKEYKPDELLKLIQEQGNIELEKFAVKSDIDKVYFETQQSRQAELNEYAMRIANSLKETK